MLATRPRFVLIAEAENALQEERWRFALHDVMQGETITACDCEPDSGQERLELLAVVRGLEALDQPSEVTLVTQSKAVLRGVTRGLPEWRNAHWRWERFGRMVPIRNADLWRRIDRALNIHKVNCRSWRISQPAATEQQNATPVEHLRSKQRGGSRVIPGVHDDFPAMVIVPGGRTRQVVRFPSSQATPIQTAVAG